MKIRIGTKGSDIAYRRSEMVAEWLTEAGHEVDLITVPDVGDRENIGQLRLGLLRGDFDLAIHRMNRVPKDTPPGLVIAAMPARHDWRDVLVGRNNLSVSGLPQGSRVATGSPVRQASLRRLHGNLEFVDLKPDLTTCLDQVAAGELDGVVTSAADILVLEREEEITDHLPTMPTPGQGALGLECRSEDQELIDVLAEFDDTDTRVCVLAERAAVFNLDLADGILAAGRATREGVLSLRVDIVPEDGSKGLSLQMGLPTSELHAVRSGQRIASALRQRGAERLGRPDAPEKPAEPEEPRPRPSSLAEARILVPREDGAMAAGLREAGLTVDAVPLQRRIVLDVSSTLDGADWLAFTSTRAVKSINELGWTLPREAKIAAIGPGTASALEELGYTVDLVPTEEAGIHALLDVFPEGEGRVLVPGSALLAPNMVAGLQQKGYKAQLIPIYTMQVLPEAPQDVAEAWREGRYDAVVVLSGSNALAMGQLLGWRDDVPVIAVGDSAARVLERAKVDVAGRTDSYLARDVVELLEKALLDPSR